MDKSNLSQRLREGRERKRIYEQLDLLWAIIESYSLGLEEYHKNSIWNIFPFSRSKLQKKEKLIAKRLYQLGNALNALENGDYKPMISFLQKMENLLLHGQETGFIVFDSQSLGCVFKRLLREMEYLQETYYPESQ